jgi:hypothetical protein
VLGARSSEQRAASSEQQQQRKRKRNAQQRGLRDKSHKSRPLSLSVPCKSQLPPAVCRNLCQLPLVLCQLPASCRGSGCVLVFMGAHAADLFPEGGKAVFGAAGCVDRTEIELGKGGCHVIDTAGGDGCRSEWTKDAGLNIHGKGQGEGRDCSIFVNRAHCEWRPYNCTPERLTTHEAASCLCCLSKHEVVVVGDSNQRTLWNQLSGFACGCESLGPGWRRCVSAGQRPRL